MHKSFAVWSHKKIVSHGVQLALDARFECRCLVIETCLIKFSVNLFIYVC